MPWLIFALLSALVFIYFRAIDDYQMILLTKGLPVIALFFWLRSAAPGNYRRWISCGLVFSLAGDLLLDWPGDLFVYGLAAFLLGHLCYIFAYLSASRRLAPIMLLIALLVGGGMFSILASQPLGELLIPVALYALTIGLMLWRALALIGAAGVARQSALLAAGGAALFVLSDSMIGINRFVAPFDAANTAIIVTYWLGQFGIAASAMQRRA